MLKTFDMVPCGKFKEKYIDLNFSYFKYLSIIDCRARFGIYLRNFCIVNMLFVIVIERTPLFLLLYWYYTRVLSLYMQNSETFLHYL